MAWNPELYHKFQQQRALPFEDLFGLIRVRPGMKVVDLGCGTGELTLKIFDRIAGSDVLGMDSSNEMLAKAAQYAQPGLRFERGAIEALNGKWDLIFSHAALHWVDDHGVLIPRLLSLLNPGGQLAVQVPSMHRHPTHALIAQIALEEPFRTALNGWTRGYPVLNIDQYAELFHEQAAEHVTVFEKVYPHLLENADALADWNIGTTMNPYFERLPIELKESFIERYRDRLRTQFPSSPVLYPFRRTLFVATVKG